MIESLLLGTFISLQSLDVGTTCYALNTGRFIEKNSLLPTSCLNIGLVKSSSVIGLIYLGNKLKTKKGKIVYYSILIGISSYPVIHNIKELRK